MDAVREYHHKPVEHPESVDSGAAFVGADAAATEPDSPATEQTPLKNDLWRLRRAAVFANDLSRGLNAGQKMPQQEREAFEAELEALRSAINTLLRLLREGVAA